MSSIWTTVPTVEGMFERTRNPAVEVMGIEFLEVGDDFIRARMPVDKRIVQPFGILQGGANHCVKKENTVCVGLEINANHIRSVTSGWVYGTARPHHVGGSTQVWEIRIETGDGKLVCLSRITMAVINA
jgi:uncharacterized protein (TIGR00369 family)